MTIYPKNQFEKKTLLVDFSIKQMQLSALKMALTINTAIIIILFATPLFANTKAVISLYSQTHKFNLQQSIKVIDSKTNAWIQVALNTDQNDESVEGCTKKTKEGKCKNFKKLKIKSKHKLQFGKIASQPSGVTKIVIDPITGSKNVIGGPDLGGQYGPAKFEVTGNPGNLFVVTLPRKITLDGQTGSIIKASQLTVHIPSQQQNGSFSFGTNGDKVGSLGPDGKATIFIGGTLTVRPGKTSGKYVGAIPLFVDYQNCC
jgi:hypothetical protein